MRYGFGRFFGHKLRVTRRHQSGGGYGGTGRPRTLSPRLDRLPHLQAPLLTVSSAYEVASRSSAEARDVLAWMDATGFDTLGDDLSDLIGDPDVELSYSDEQKAVLFEPSLQLLAALGSAARERAKRMATPAPTLALEMARTQAVRLLMEVAHFHGTQVRLLGKFTPEAFADGSVRELTAEFQAGYQPLIDQMVPPAAALAASLETLSADLSRRS